MPIPHQWIKSPEKVPGYMDRTVSVIVPVHDRAGQVLDALESIRAQDHRPIQVVVVDDGSKDESHDVVSAWSAIHDQPGTFEVELIRQANQGAPAARNRGIVASRGAFIQFLDSDDVLLPGKFSEAIALFERDDELDLVYGPWLVREGGLDRMMWGPDLEQRPWVAEVVVKYLWTAAPVYSRRIIDLTGPWNIDLRRSQDREFAARAVVHMRKAKRTAEPRSVYRIFHTGASITASMVKPDPAHPWSVYEADRIMRQLVLAEGSPRLRDALRGLAGRDLRAARRAITCGAPWLTRSILLGDRTIWTLGHRKFLEAIFILLLSVFPKKITSSLAISMIDFKKNRKKI